MQAEIDALKQQLAEATAELAAADQLIIFINKGQAWLTPNATVDVVNWSLKAERRKPSGGEVASE
jgi:hypothetical protein